MTENIEKTRATEIILRPHISEKAFDLAQERKYVFEVHPRATKIDIKRAIKELYKVEVERVWIVNVPPKIKVRKRGYFRKPRTLKRKGYKKAIVKLKEGHKLEIFESEAGS